jgi:hypothetical protein
MPDLPADLLLELSVSWNHYASVHLRWGSFPQGNQDQRHLYVFPEEVARLPVLFRSWLASTPLCDEAEADKENLWFSILEPSLKNLRLTVNVTLARHSKRSDAGLPHW